MYVLTVKQEIIATIRRLIKLGEVIPDRSFSLLVEGSNDAQKNTHSQVSIERRMLMTTKLIKLFIQFSIKIFWNKIG
jgi:hypothetical protein